MEFVGYLEMIRFGVLDPWASFVSSHPLLQKLVVVGESLAGLALLVESWLVS